MKLILTMALLTACTIGVHAQTWYLIGYDKQGNVVKNGGVPAVIDIQQDFGYLLSSLGNSASYFSIMRKNGEGLWFTEVYKAKFQLDGGVVTQIESTPSVMPTIVVGDDHTVGGCPGSDLAVVVRAVVGLENILRGLDEEVIRRILQVEDDDRCLLLRLQCFVSGGVLLRNLVIGNVVDTSDFQTGLPRGVGGYLLPTATVMLTNPTLVVAVEVAHLVEDGVAEVIHRGIVVGTYLDAYTLAVPPIELTELPAVVGEGHLDRRQFVVEHRGVELIKPILNVFESRYHMYFLSLRYKYNDFR